MLDILTNRKSMIKGVKSMRLTFMGLVPAEEGYLCEYVCIIGGGVNGEASGEVYIGVIRGGGW